MDVSVSSGIYTHVCTVAHSELGTNWQFMSELDSLQIAYMVCDIFSSIKETKPPKRLFAITATFSYHVYFIYNVLFWMVAKICWKVVRTESVPVAHGGGIPF